MTCRLHDADAPGCGACVARSMIAARRAERLAAAPPPKRRYTLEERHTCVHRGVGPVGESRCAEGCGDKPLLPLFACAVHGRCSVLKRTESKAQQCVRCGDRVPLPGMPDGYGARRGKAPPAAKAPNAWAVGLTCVPERLATTLPRTLASLAAAGFPAPRLFADGAAPGPGWDALGCELTFRPQRLRTFGNWLMGAWELAVRRPDATHYLMVQDDVVFCRGVADYLDAAAWPAKGYLNLFIHPRQRAEGRGFVPAGGSGLGGLALAFTREGLRACLTRPGMFDAPARDGRTAWAAADTKVAGAMRAAGWREFVHRPSLVQHTGDRSVMGHGDRGGRVAPDFQGEGWDARQLLGIDPPATPPRTPGGSMPDAQRRRVAAEIAGRAPCNVLIFGAGDDTAAYVAANPGGRTAVLEDRDDWLDVARRAGAEAHRVRYTTRAADGVRPDVLPLEVPASVSAELWDVILIDAPRGEGEGAPGRQQPAALAARLAAEGGVILAHDCDRGREAGGYASDARCYAHHLGEPGEIVHGPPDLGVWRSGKMALLKSGDLEAGPLPPQHSSPAEA